MREQREKLKMSQERVAESLGVSGPTLSEMESGHIAVSFERWLHWCGILKKSPTDILKAWERESEFSEISQQRRTAYYKTIDSMIKYGYGLEVDTIMRVFQEILDRDKRKRTTERSKREIRRYFPRMR